MKSLLTLTLLLSSLSAWAYMPTKLVEADNFVRSQAIATAIAQLKLNEKDQLTYPTATKAVPANTPMILSM